MRAFSWRLVPLFLSFIVGVAQAAPTVTVFVGNDQSGNPQVLAAGPDGVLYVGGSKGVFRISGSGDFAMVAPMSSVNQLIAGYDGYFYGTSATGTFKLSPEGAVSTITATPLRGLVLGTDGNLYGTQSDGVYRLTQSGTLSRISGWSLQNLAQASSGYLFGTELNCDGYCYSWTTNIYQVDPQWGVATQTGSIDCTQGVVSAALTPAPDGTLYGVSEGYYYGYDVCAGTGGIFSLDAKGKYTQRVAFESFGGSSTPLLYASDGTLFGFADAHSDFDYNGGFSNTPPRLFRFRPAANSLTGTDELVTIADNFASGGKLAQTRDGTIYGISGNTIYRLKRPTTLTGHGTFSVTPTTGAITINPTATLTDDMIGGRGIEGQTVRFSRKGVQLCTARTDATGRATCQIAAKDHDGGFDATFAETDLYAATSVHSGLVCVGTTCPWLQ